LFNKHIVYSYFIGMIVFVISMFYGPWLLEDDESIPNLYNIYINDTYVGTTRKERTAHECLQEAKEAVSRYTDEITYMNADMQVEGIHAIWGEPDSRSEIIDNITGILQGTIQETLQRSYMLKINDYVVALKDIEEVRSVLQAAVDKYDEACPYEVNLVRDTARAFYVLTSELEPVEKVEENFVDRNVAGFTSMESALFNEEYYDEELDFEDFDLGFKDMEFVDKVEITECYLKPEELTPMDEVIRYLTEDQDVQEIYKVKSGDTLSGISIKTGIPMEELIAMNDALVNERSIINVGQELVISIPTPTFTVAYTITEYREEEYSAEVQYVDNDKWYTTKQVTLQEPSNGFRKAVSDVTYYNGEVHHTEILKQEVLMEAVPKIVERGTQIPPTYIKPLYGGRYTSGFGWRSFRGGGYHYGIDWATPTGTTIYASSGGTVTRAGWSSSYGYCVYIQHPGGLETRYAHNSKLLVTVGQTVKQGQAIALSGNTGDSSGPHLHFEIRINGKAVNPKNYLENY